MKTRERSTGGPGSSEAPREEKNDSTLRVPCEVYSRIIGYLRPVQNWHEGKQQEFRERKTFQVSGSVDPEGEQA